MSDICTIVFNKKIIGNMSILQCNVYAISTFLLTKTKNISKYTNIQDTY